MSESKCGKSPKISNNKSCKEQPETKKQNELYWKWRNIQREQLGISANIYMVFASAILGFVLNFLIRKEENPDIIVLIILSLGIIQLLLSLGSYAWFIHNRLEDFRFTAGYYGMGKLEDEVSRLTKNKGIKTWILYYMQMCFLIRGFICSIIGLGIFIYS